jgi:hypothetical protein
MGPPLRDLREDEIEYLAHRSGARHNALAHVQGERMARNGSIEDIIDAAVDRVVQRILPAMQRALAEAGASGTVRNGRTARRAPSPRRRRPREEMTRWVADNRARRVPTFVIEATGLDTKKKIVARFGPNVAFEKGKPLPPVAAGAAKGVKAGAPAAASRVVKPRPPVIRKAAAAS